MISFVWSSRYPFIAGAGGSENYTAGHIRELQRRGIATRVITIGHGKHDGRQDFPDIEFKALHSKEQLSLLNDTLVFVTYPLHVRTKKPAYTILHCPPLSAGLDDPLFDMRGVRGKNLVAASRFSAAMWEHDLNLARGSVSVVYPFADSAFRSVQRPPFQHYRPEPLRGSYFGRTTRILFSGRLHPDKGIYTLLAALHTVNKLKLPVEITATMAGAHSDDGQIVKTILEAHPWVKVVPSGRNPGEVAKLMAQHDLVVMPSTDIFWKELFGMVSVEAQHAGCRVVASNAGGLPETDCGGLMLVKPDDPQALAEGIAKAAKLGPLTAQERRRAASVFTVQESVDSLLQVLGKPAGQPGSLLKPVRIMPALNRLYETSS